MKGYVSIEILLIGAAILGIFYGILPSFSGFATTSSRDYSAILTLRSFVTDFKLRAERTLIDAGGYFTIYSPIDLNLSLKGNEIVASEGNSSVNLILPEFNFLEKNLSLNAGERNIFIGLENGEINVEVVG